MVPTYDCIFVGKNTEFLMSQTQTVKRIFTKVIYNVMARFAATCSFTRTNETK